MPAVGLTLGCSDKKPEATVQKGTKDKSADKAPPVKPDQAKPAPTVDKSADKVERRALNFDENGRALRGYDPVAYHTAGKAVAGADAHNYKWMGATWQFASAENRDAFAKDPGKYAPENGGFCTFGVVLGKKFDGDPQVWHVKDDGLFVFLNAEVKGKFLQDEPGNMAKVKTNWPNIKDKTIAELSK